MTTQSPIPLEGIIHFLILVNVAINSIRSGGGGRAFKAPPQNFSLTHLILELHHCALGTFSKK